MDRSNSGRAVVFRTASIRRALLATVACACASAALLADFATPALAATSRASAKSKPAAKEEMPKGPLQIVVSIGNQHVTLYSNGTRVAQGPVSTGIPGKPTPTGVFSIIQKDRYHHSNLYSNAPMPFMERITWSGVALHEGPLPGYPASHGCIRMTHDFAVRLWGITKLGVRVIVAHNEVVPVEFSHPNLFTPATKPAEPPVANADPEKHVDVQTPVRLAQAGANSPAMPDASGSAPASADSALSPPAADPLSGPLKAERGGADTTAATPAVVSPAVAQPAPPTADSDPAKPAAVVDDPDKPDPNKAKSVAQPVKHSGQVAVFISRKEKRLFVRQGFVPLFDMPVEIDHPEQPFGTHVFTAMGLTDDGAGMRWNLMSMPSGPVRISGNISKKGQRGEPAVVIAPQTAAQVLDRIQIPQEARDRIDEILAPGASLVVSDQGLGGETGQGTDFIVLTR